MAAAYGLFWLRDPALIRRLSREDGPFETVGAVALLFAAITAFLAWRRAAAGNDFGLFRTRRNVFFLLLAVLFLFGAGEEISWGQRLLRFPTPGWLAAINHQGEANLHNLFEAANRRFNPSFFNSVFWFLYFLAVPVGARVSRKLASLLARISLPIGPVWAGLLMAANHGLSRLAELRTEAAWPGLHLNYGVVEVKEAILEILYLAAVFTILSRLKAARHSGEGQSLQSASAPERQGRHGVENINY
jgi:hypothetical protein